MWASVYTAGPFGRYKRDVRKLGMVMLLGLGACSGTETFPVTGGFEETVIDKRARHVQGMQLRDLDNDGDLEIVAALSLTDAVHIYESTSDDRTAWQAQSISGTASIVSVDVDTGDLDADGDLDVVSVGLFQRDVGIGSAGDVVWYENPGAPLVGSAWTERGILRANRNDDGSYSGLYGPYRVRLGDIDSDGDLDVVIGTLATVDNAGAVAGTGLYYFDNIGTASAPEFQGPIAIDPNVAVDALALADLNGNGTLEIIIAGGTTRQAAVYRYDGTDFTQQVLLTQRAMHDLAVVQLDDDAPPEIVIGLIETTSAAVFRIDVDIDQGTVTSTSIITDIDNPAGSEPRITAADFGNGRGVEIVVGNDGTGLIARYRQEDDAWVRQDVRLGYNGINTLRHADLDGDGKDDLITGTYDFGSRDRVSWWRNAD